MSWMKSNSLPLINNPPSEGFTLIGHGSYADAYAENGKVELICRPFTAHYASGILYDLSREILIEARKTAPKESKKHFPDIKRKRIEFGKEPYKLRWSNKRYLIPELVYSMPRYSCENFSAENFNYVISICSGISKRKIPTNIPESLILALNHIYDVGESYGIISGNWDMGHNNASESSRGVLIIRDPFFLEDTGFGRIKISELWPKKYSDVFSSPPIEVKE